MKKTIFAALAVFTAAALFFAGCAPKSEDGMTIKKGTLMIGMEITYPPLEYKDENNNPAGFDVELGKAIAAKMGLKAEFIDTAWDGIFAGVESDKYDCVISGVTITPERLAAHNFSKPYIGNAMAIVLMKGSPLSITRPEDLAGKGISYQAETTADFFMADYAANGLQFTPYEYDSVMHCFDEMTLGRVDAVVTDLLVAVDYVSPADSLFEIVWQGQADEKFGICMKKGSDALTAAVDKAVDELFADGTMLKLSQDIFKLDMVSSARQ
jgi:polar amino acid transport system substrate-binding protein